MHSSIPEPFWGLEFVSKSLGGLGSEIQSILIVRCVRFIELTSFRLCSVNTEGSSGLRLIKLLRVVGIGFKEFRVYVGFVRSRGTLAKA